MNRLPPIALAAALALATPVVDASPLASVEISNFQFQLIDLDPNDGITPSIDLSAFPGSLAAVGGDVSAEDHGASVFGPAVAAASGSYGAFGLSLISGDLTEGGSVQLTATAGDFPGSPATVTSGALFGSNDVETRFTLSPQTELKMTGTVAVVASTDQLLHFDEQADASVIFGFLLGLGVYGDHNFLEVASQSSDPARSQSSGGILSIGYANGSDAAVQAGFYIEADSRAAVFPQPIPEPANITFMLAALAGMAALARARRRSSGRAPAAPRRPRMRPA
jgi:hypothetical protein